jgi:hypothetical protein
LYFLQAQSIILLPQTYRPMRKSNSQSGNKRQVSDASTQVQSVRWLELVTGSVCQVV